MTPAAGHVHVGAIEFESGPGVIEFGYDEPIGRMTCGAVLIAELGAMRIVGLVACTAGLVGHQFMVQRIGCERGRAVT